jgi:hypothetical protein
MRCRIYDTNCINPVYCDFNEACCAGDMDCKPDPMDRDTLIRIAQRKHNDAMETCRQHLLHAAKWIRDLRLPDEKIPELDLLARSLTDASVFVAEVKELDLG